MSDIKHWSNVALSLDPDFTTIQCVYNQDAGDHQVYTFVAHRELAVALRPGQSCLTDDKEGRVRVVVFRSADEVSKIDPFAPWEYRIVFAVVDTSVLDTIKNNVSFLVDNLLAERTAKARAQALQALGLEPRTVKLTHSKEITHD